MDLLKEAADQIWWLTPNEKIQYIIENPYSVIEYTRWIRNNLQLWHMHALTENWRNHPESRDIRNGIDFSEDHPDMIAAKILKLVIQRYLEEK